jgi:hypothetical protein
MALVCAGDAGRRKTVAAVVPATTHRCMMGRLILAQLDVYCTKYMPGPMGEKVLHGGNP